MATYVAHVADDRIRSSTACGAPWQRWQAPPGWRGPVIGPSDQPRGVGMGRAADMIRQCPRCTRLVADAIQGSSR